MCGCYDVADCVCFLTFFITALVALLSVLYLVVFLDSFSITAPGKLSHLLASLYFLVMTLLGCMVFAGIQRRSITLLKWPGRLLVFLLISGLLANLTYLWIVDRTHHAGVHDLEGKTLKLFIMLCVVIVYFFVNQKLITSIEHPVLHGAQSSPELDDDSDHLTHPALMADFIKKKGRGGKYDIFNPNEVSRPFNAASDGINYYIVMLESPRKSGETRYAIAKKSRIFSKRYKHHVSSGDPEDADDEAEGDDRSCCSITEV